MKTVLDNQQSEGYRTLFTSEREEEVLPMGGICMEECAVICANDY